MQTKYFLILLSTIIFGMCQQSKPKRDKIFDLSFEQKAIKLNGKGTEWYLNWQLHPQKGLKTLIAFNSMNNSLDFFDLETGQLSNTYYFEEEGPNGIGNPSEFYFQDEEHLYFKDARFLNMTNLEGRVKKRIRIWQQNTSADSLANDINPIHIPSYFSFYIDSITSDMYFARTAYIDRQMFLNYDENSKIIGKLNWNMEKAEDLPVYLPDFYLDREEYFGTAYNPQLCLWADKLIINYQTSSKIFVYNSLGKEKQVYDIPSAYTPNQLKGVPISAREDFTKVNQNLSNGTRFYPLHYDKSNGIFYRFHELKSYNDKREIIKRDIYLMIMNENFKVIQEEKMPETVNAPSTVVVLPKGGLLVDVAGNQVREDHFTYNVIKLKRLKD